MFDKCLIYINTAILVILLVMIFSSGKSASESFGTNGSGSILLTSDSGDLSTQTVSDFKSDLNTNSTINDRLTKIEATIGTTFLNASGANTLSSVVNTTAAKDTILNNDSIFIKGSNNGYCRSLLRTNAAGDASQIDDGGSYLVADHLGTAGNCGSNSSAYKAGTWTITRGSGVN